MRVRVEVEETYLEGDHCEVPGIIVTCTKCGATVEVFGQSEASVKRGCVMLKEQCDDRNFYTVDEDW